MADFNHVFKKPKLDWSYATRKQMALLKYDPAQTQLTDYYKVVDQIEQLVKSEPTIMNAFHISK